MDVGIGLPNAVRGHQRRAAGRVGEARRGRGFSSLGTIDRIAYDNYEPLTALTAAAAVTERIGLWTSVLLAPLRPNGAELAKRALSIQALSGGRLTSGSASAAARTTSSSSGVEMGEPRRLVRRDAAAHHARSGRTTGSGRRRRPRRS